MRTGLDFFAPTRAFQQNRIVVDRGHRCPGRAPIGGFMVNPGAFRAFAFTGKQDNYPVLPAERVAYVCEERKKPPARKPWLRFHYGLNGQAEQLPQDNRL